MRERAVPCARTLCSSEFLLAGLRRGAGVTCRQPAQGPWRGMERRWMRGLIRSVRFRTRCKTSCRTGVERRGADGAAYAGHRFDGRGRHG